MRPVVVLLPSPLVGPEVLRPLSLVLARGGWSVPVVDLGPVGSPPYWEVAASRLAGRVADWRADGGGRAVLVGHSRAGAWLPALAPVLEAAGWDVAATVFLDAVLPGPEGVALPGALAAHLDGLTGPDGRLPPWPDWWPPSALAATLPDVAQRERIRAGCAPVPRALLDEVAPVPDGWPDHPVGYLVLTYADEAERAAARGWPVRAVDGDHLAPVTAPALVARALLALLGDLGVEGGLGAPAPPAVPDAGAAGPGEGPDVVDLRDRFV